MSEPLTSKRGFDEDSEAVQRNNKVKVCFEHNRSPAHTVSMLARTRPSVSNTKCPTHEATPVLSNFPADTSPEGILQVPTGEISVSLCHVSMP